MNPPSRRERGMLRGKDIETGTVIGTKRVREVVSRGRYVLFTYDYLVSDDDESVRWYRQNPPPVGKIAAHAQVEASELSLAIR